MLQAERTGHKLQTMAQPKQWPVSNGHTVEVDTPFTTRWGLPAWLTPFPAQGVGLSCLIHIPYTMRPALLAAGLAVAARWTEYAALGPAGLHMRLHCKWASLLSISHD